MEQATTTEPTVYRIPECNVAGLIEHIAEINKTAAKLGVDPVTLTQVGVDHVESKNASGIKSIRSFFLYTITGATPKLAG
jgi:hypothetical protein